MDAMPRSSDLCFERAIRTSLLNLHYETSTVIRGTVGADQGSAETLQEEFSASQTLALCRGGDVYRRRCRSTVRGRTKGLCRADEKLSELAKESAGTAQPLGSAEIGRAHV